MFVWVGPAFSLLALGYWALAGRLFDLRQGKRLFGLVGAGEEVSTVVGLFSVPLLVRVLGGPLHLLPIALVGLARLPGRRRRHRPRGSARPWRRRGGAGAPAAGEGAAPGLGDLLRNRYFLLLAALVVLLNLANYIVDFGFLSQVRGRFQGGAQLAQFIGLFFGVTKTLELLAKVFLSGRLLSQFGLKFGLLGRAGPARRPAPASPSRSARSGLPAAHFFVLVALAKLVWIVSRTTTFEPSFRVLYQPVRASTGSRSRPTSRARRASSRSASSASRCCCSAAARPSTPSPSSTRSCPLLAVWVVVSVLAHRDYRDKLMDSLTARPRQARWPRPLDVLRPRPARGRPAAAGARLRPAGEVGGRGVRARGSPRCSPTPSRALRVAALEHVGRERLADLQEWASRLPERRGPGGAAGGAQRARPPARGRGAGRRGRVASWTSPPSADPGERVLAAEAIGRGTGERAERLWVLLFDAEWTVRRAALDGGRPSRSARVLAADHRRARVARALAAGGRRRSSRSASARCRRRSAPSTRPTSSPRVRQRHPARSTRRWAGPGPRRCSPTSSPSRTRSVRAQALVALSRTGYQADAAQAAVVTRAIEALVGRSAWNMSAVLDLGEDERLAPVVRALDEEIESVAHRTSSSCSSLVHDPWAIGLVRENLESGSSETTVYALEILDLAALGRAQAAGVPAASRASPTRRRCAGWRAACPRHRMAPLERLSADRQPRLRQASAPGRAPVRSRRSGDAGGRRGSRPGRVALPPATR